MKYYDIEQNTDEWLDMRAGKITSSNLGCIMSNFGKAFGEPAKKYAVNIAIEQITGKPILSNYQNAHMQRGHEQEPEARKLYEAETFTEVSNGGFFSDGEIGCSPDGILENGVIEIKSVIAPVHFANIKRQNVDPAYKWQCIGNLLFTEKDWMDFISYCPEFPEGKQLYVFRMVRTAYNEEIKMINGRVQEFKELILSSRETILNSKYFIK